MIVEVVLRDPADREQRLLAAVVAADMHPRSHGRDVDAVLDAELAELRAREGRDRDADVLDALLALLRGHDHLFEDAFGVGGQDDSQAQRGDETDPESHAVIPLL